MYIVITQDLRLLVDDKSINLEEADEDETNKKKLCVETDDKTNSLISDIELESPCLEDSVQPKTLGATTWTPTSARDLMPFPVQCTSDSQEQCHAVTSSDNGADPGSSNKTDAEVAASPWPLATAARLNKPEISENSFVVFKGVPPGKTPDPLALSVAANKRQEADDINRAKKTLKLQFTGRTARLLRHLGIAAEKCDKLARCIMRGKKVKINADLHVPLSTEDIYKYYRYFVAVESYQCLLISAPEIGDSDNQREHREEMRNFCLQAFPVEHFDAACLEKTITWREVSSSEQIRTFISDFFRRPDGIRAKNALHAVIVFFGHGSEQGFCAGQQDMALDDITLLVKDEWRQAILEYPKELPVKIEIIFSQCYSHLHSRAVQTDRFKVIALTTPDNPLTTSTENEAGSFENNDLNAYAAETLRSETAKMAAWRRSNECGFVDLSRRSGCENLSATPVAVAEDTVMHPEDTVDAHQANYPSML